MPKARMFSFVDDNAQHVSLYVETDLTSKRPEFVAAAFVLDTCWKNGALVRRCRSRDSRGAGFLEELRLCRAEPGPATRGHRLSAVVRCRVGDRAGDLFDLSSFDLSDPQSTDSSQGGFFLPPIQQKLDAGSHAVRTRFGCVRSCKRSRPTP